MSQEPSVAIAGQRRGLFYGWWIVLASSTLALYTGGVFYYGFTAFFTPIRAAFGWSGAATSLAFTLQRLEGGVMAPLVGYLIDRLGPRKLMFLASIIAGVGLLLLSRINSLWTFYAAFLVASVGFGAAPYMPATTTVANWFSRKRGLAFGFFQAGYGASGLVVPGVVLLINAVGWRNTLVLVAIGMVVLGVPLSLVFRHRPEPYGYLPDGAPPSDRQAREALEKATSQDLTPGQAVRSRSFWFLTYAYSVSLLASSAVMVHEMPYLESIGISRETAAIAMVFLTGLSLIGRLGLGWLGDLLPKRYLMAVCQAGMALGILLFSQVNSRWMLALFLLLYSPAYGGLFTVRPNLQAEYFGARFFGTIQGLLSFFTMPLAMLGPLFAGWVFDLTDSYRLAFIIIAAVVVSGVPALILTTRPAARLAPAGART